MDYITIIQGDDTNFLGDQFLVINFNTDIDLSGFTATFSLGDVTLTYGDLSGKNFEVILSDEITSNLKLGKQYGELKLIDREQRIRTVTSVIPFLVRKGVNEEIKFVNNSLNVSMNINDTVLDVVIETPGIARAEATRMMSYCNEANQSAQNYSNMALNTLNTINNNVADFDNRYIRLSETIDKAYDTCDTSIKKLNECRTNYLNEIEILGKEKLDLVKEQADIATQKAQEATQILINKASIDLDNLSETGQAIIDEKISRLGDTMSGNLVINKSNPVIQTINTNTSSSYSGLAIKSIAFDSTTNTAPSANINLGRVLFQDENNAATGWVQQYFNTSNQLVTSLGSMRIVNGENKSASLNLYVDSAGGAYFNFPRCTSKAGTTSTASTSRVAVIVTNYKSGTSWYRVWSDGWIEQGGQVSITSAGQKVTLLKTMADTNYFVAGNGLASARYAACYTKTTSSFLVYTGDDESFNSSSICWYVCGY